MLVAENVEGLLREMHGQITASVARLDSIEDKVDGLKVDLEHTRREVTARQDKTNGTVAAIKSEQEQQKGAVAVIRWLAAFTIAIVSAGAAVAGVVLAIVASNGG